MKENFYIPFHPGKKILCIVMPTIVLHTVDVQYVRASLCLNVNRRIFGVGRATWRFPARLVHRETKQREGKGFAKIASPLSSRVGTRTHISAGNASVWEKMPKGPELNEL